MSKLTIEKVMHPLPHSITETATLEAALHMLREHNVRHLPVTEGSVVTGVISERDIDFALRVDKKEPTKLMVKDAYSAEPYIVPPGESIANVAAKMAHEKLGCAVVVEDLKLLGIFTTTDALRLLSETLANRLEQ